MSSPRIIAGKARGRRLKSVPGDITRPVTDRVKESLFNILNGDIIDASLLDLFGGTGSIGIEALSRGAAFVRFVDLNRAAIETIKANLETTDLKSGAEVVRANAFTLLRQPADRSFDYIYIAPPQYKDLWSQALAELDSHPAWLAPGGWVIVQIHPREYQAATYQHFTLIEERKYGSTLLVFFEATSESAPVE